MTSERLGCGWIVIPISCGVPSTSLAKTPSVIRSVTLRTNGVHAEDHVGLSSPRRPFTKPFGSPSIRALPIAWNGNLDSLTS